MPMILQRPALLLASTVVLALAAVGGALLTQHVMGMMPCAWCVLQRLIFLAIAAAALLGLLWHSAAGRRIGALLTLLLAGCGVAAAGWQHFVAAKSSSCAQSLADRVVGTLGLDRALPDVFAAYASCADAAATLAGLPYEAWSGGLYALLGLAMVAVLLRPLSR